MFTKPLMSVWQFEDRVRAGKLSRRQAHRVLASFGVGMALTPALTGRATAAPEDQPLITMRAPTRQQSRGNVNRLTVIESPDKQRIGARPAMALRASSIADGRNLPSRRYDPLHRFGPFFGAEPR